MIGVDGGYMTAYLDQALAREMYPDINVPTAITFALTGVAAGTYLLRVQVDGAESELQVDAFNRFIQPQVTI